MTIIRLIAISLIISIFIIAGCDKSNTSPCVSIPGSSSYTVNAFDESDTTGGYFGDSIANFIFTESTTNYTGVGNCPDNSCSISLNIKNLTSKKVTFKYTVGFTYNNGASTQNFQGNASIASAGTFNAGTLSNNCSVVTAPVTSVQLSQISY